MTALTTPTNQSFSVGEFYPQRLQSMSPRLPPNPSSKQSSNVVIQFELYSNFPEEEEQQSRDSRESGEQNGDGENHRRYKFRMMEEKEGELSLIVEYRSKIQVLMNKIIELNEKVFYFQDYNSKLLAEVESHKQKQASEMMNNEHLKSMLWKKDDAISAQSLVIDTLSIKVEELERHWVSTKGVEERLKEKEGRIRELNKRVEKIIGINKCLQEEIKELNVKILEMEKEAQISAFNQIMENRSRLKEAIGVTVLNKENHQQNQKKAQEEGGYRLSLENTYQRRSKLNNLTGLTNSTSPLERKQKSHSIIGRIKH